MDKLFILTRNRINLIAEAMVAAGLYGILCWMWSGWVAAGPTPHPMLAVVWLGSGRPIAASYALCWLWSGWVEVGLPPNPMLGGCVAAGLSPHPRLVVVWLGSGRPTANPKLGGWVAAGLSPHPMLDVVWLGSDRTIAASYAGCGLVGAPGPWSRQSQPEGRPAGWSGQTGSCSRAPPNTNNSSSLFVIFSVSVVDRHRFDADPDPESDHISNFYTCRKVSLFFTFIHNMSFYLFIFLSAS